MISLMPVLLGLWAGGAKLPLPFEQLFPLEEMIVLEEREKSLVGGIGWLSQVDDRLLIVDNIQDLVLIFDLRGRYLGLLGNKGQGPGEYTSPSQAMAGPFDSLCVVDRGRAAILFYDRTGQHRFTLSRAQIKPSFPRQVHWAGSNFFGVDALGSESCPTGSFSAGQLQKDGSVGEVRCFGGGNLLEQQLNFSGPIPRAGLSKEGLWVAREYDDQVHLVDWSGRTLRSFAYPATNTIRWQDIKGCKTRKEALAVRNTKTQIQALFPFGSYLMVLKVSPSLLTKGRVFALDLLSPQGALLISSMKASAGLPLALDDSLLISQFTIPEDERALPDFRKKFPEEFAMLEARNIDWRQLGNPILRLGRVDAAHIAALCQKEQP